MKFPKGKQELCTLTQAAKLLSISEYKLRKAVMSGEIRSKRCTDSPKSHFRFKKEWLLDYQRALKPPSFWIKLGNWLGGCPWGWTPETMRPGHNA